MENKQKKRENRRATTRMLKNYCDKNGLKIYKVLEKHIEELCKPKKKDIYGDD